MSDDEAKLLPIGAIARATNLTVKALRHYHEIGLLIPRSVDSWTGYRGYGHEQLATASLIATLRELELPLAQMPIVLDDPTSPAAQQCLRVHQERLRTRTAELDHVIARIDTFIDGRTDMEFPTTLTTPEVRDAVSTRAFAITATANLAELQTLIPQLAQQASQAIGAAGIIPKGPLFARYLDNPQTGEPFRLEVGIPIYPGDGVDAVHTVDLPGGRRIVAEHRGGYDALPMAWAAFFRWVIDEGHAVEGAPWESYLTTPMDSENPDDWVTELVFPLGG